MNNVRFTKMRFINWHKCEDSGILNISGDTMFSGSTGSGKSTAIDAFYSTMAVDNSNFNKAANSKSKRDIKGYVRCQVNELNADNTTNKYQRHGNVYSYVLIELLSEKNEKNIIGVCHHSRNENAPVVSHYFSITNCTIEDVEIIDSNRIPVVWENFKLKYNNKSGSRFESYDTKREAKALFTGCLGFSREIDTYENFTKAVASAIAFQTTNISNINTFFKETLFKNDPINVLGVKETYEKYEELRCDLIEQNKRKEALSDIIEMQNRIIEIKKTLDRFSIIKEIADKNNAENQLKISEKEKEKCDEDIKRLEQKVSVLTNEKDDLLSRKAQLEVSENAQHLKIMKSSLEDKETRLQTVTQAYDQFVNAVSNFNALIPSISNILNENISKIELQTIIQESEKYNDFLNTLTGLIDRLGTFKAENDVISNNLKAENTKLKSEIFRMEKGNMPQDENTTLALNVINDFYTENDIDEKPLLLYQCMDIKPKCEDWQMPIETLLNKARFNIIVNPVYYNDISKLFKKNKIEGVSLIDTTALNMQFNTETPSLCDMLTFSNEYAKKYFEYRYGKVIPVESCIDMSLDKNKTYLGKDGTHYATKSFNIPRKAVTLYIGEKARLELLKSKKEKLEENNQKINDIFDIVSKINNIKHNLNNIDNYCRNIDYRIFVLIQSLPEEIECEKANIQKFENENNLLLHDEMLSEYTQKIELKEAEITQLRNDIRKKNQLIGGYIAKIDECKTNLNILIANIETVKSNDTDLYQDAYESYLELCNDKRKTTFSISALCNESRNKKSSEFNTIDKTLTAKQSEYMRKYNDSISCCGFDSIDAFFKEYDAISINGLPDLIKQLEIAQMEYHAQVKSHVFNRLQENVRNVRTDIKNLNKILAENPFGDNYYKIQIIGPADGFEDILNIVENYNPDEQLNLFTSSNSLMQDDFDKLITAIEEDPKNGDYRNYFNIDIQVTKKIGDITKNFMLSKVIGTNSGGETQIPFYVLCAIAILNVTNSKDILKSMPKLNILDEAFDKMDTPSIQNVMNFYKTLGFQTILSAPDSKNEILSDIVDNRIAVLNKASRGFKNIQPKREMLEFTKIKD